MTHRQRALGLMVGSWLGLVWMQCSGCNTPAQTVVSDLTTALDLTQAACSVADTTGQTYVILGCTIATTMENGAVQVANLFVPATPTTAAALLKKHPETAASKALVAQYQAAHPVAH
jgi:hypothetical protein